MSLSRIYRLPSNEIANRTITSPHSEALLRRSGERSLGDGIETETVEQALAQEKQIELENALHEREEELLQLETRREALLLELARMEDEAEAHAKLLYEKARDIGAREGFEAGADKLSSR